MAKKEFIVYAKYRSICSLNVEADTKEEAEEIAKTCKKPSIVNLDDEMALMEWKYEKK